MSFDTIGENMSFDKIGENVSFDTIGAQENGSRRESSVGVQELSPLLLSLLPLS